MIPRHSSGAAELLQQRYMIAYTTTRPLDAHVLDRRMSKDPVEHYL